MTFLLFLGYISIFLIEAFPVVLKSLTWSITTNSSKSSKENFSSCASQWTISNYFSKKHWMRLPLFCFVLFLFLSNKCFFHSNCISLHQLTTWRQKFIIDDKWSATYNWFQVPRVDCLLLNLGHSFTIDRDDKTFTFMKTEINCKHVIFHQTCCTDKKCFKSFTNFYWKKQSVEERREMNHFKCLSKSIMSRTT